MKPLDMTADPGCPTGPQPAEVVVANAGKLANVFVYVKEGLPQGNFAVPSEPVVLDQKGCRYNPHMLGIMAGQPLKITNTDTADHNIHDMPSNNPPFNESQMPTDKPVIKKFPNAEMMIPVQCNQHPWMRAYINVMHNPYFAVSAPDGSFEIKNLPPGEYTIAAVHEKFGEQTMKVKVGPKENGEGCVCLLGGAIKAFEITEESEGAEDCDEISRMANNDKICVRFNLAILAIPSDFRIQILCCLAFLCVSKFGIFSNQARW